MDNIEFWIYIIFAVIYFVARALRGKPKQKPVSRPKSPLDVSDDQPQSTAEQPMSFEDLLEEITGRKSLEEEPSQDPTRVEQEKKKSDSTSVEVFEEGKSRSFADDESRRIYEESIKRAEQTEISYEPDEKFKSAKLFSQPGEEEVGNPLTEEIKAMLQSEDAKKAIILQEILNRKY